jgi:endoglucanase
MPEFYAKNAGVYYDDKLVNLKGINFFGFETEVYCLHGLWQVSLKSLLDFIKNNKFNAIRIPLSLELVFGLDTLKCKSINTTENPEMTNWTPGQLLDTVVNECAKRGILIMPDIHRSTGNGTITELWYDTLYSENKLIDAWKIIVKRYINNTNMFAVDLRNEPHGKATWGISNPKTDWNKAAERIGNAILDINPRLLIFVEGVEKVDGTNSWWGGNMRGVQNHPINLKINNKLVYSPHVYGPSVAKQPYFDAATFPNNLPNIWDDDFGYIKKNNLGTLVIGEWGGKMLSSNKDDVWQNALGDYILENQIAFFYWTINPNSHDTFGLLEDDWKTPVIKKLELLNRVCPNPSNFTFTQQTQPPKPITPPETVKPITLPETIKPQKPTTKPSNINVEIKDVNQWNNGIAQFYQQDAVCKNTTTNKINDVQLQISLIDGSLEQSWNCQCVVQQKVMMLSFPQWLINCGGLNPGETIVFGYIVKGNNKPVLQNMR